MRHFFASSFVLALCAFSIPRALAEDAGTTGPNGMMFCQQQDHLQEFFLALVKQDKEWIAQLDDCIVLKPNLKMSVIQEMPSDTKLGHVDKVRVFARGSSFVGYAVILNLDADK